MAAVATEILARLARPQEASKFSRQHLANSLWAFATLSLHPSASFLEAAAAAMRERVSQCNPQEISNTVWAFATIGEWSSLPSTDCTGLVMPREVLLGKLASVHMWSCIMIWAAVSGGVHSLRAGSPYS